jgi:hypothetical protein
MVGLVIMLQHPFCFDCFIILCNLCEKALEFSPLFILFILSFLKSVSIEFTCILITNAFYSLFLLLFLLINKSLHLVLFIAI